MKYAIVSDIHSNLDALKVVIEHIQSYKCDKIICCGDIVGYGPNPNECVELIRNLHNVKAILGNHDASVVGKLSLENFTEYAKISIEINKRLLTKANMQYLASLSDVYEWKNMIMVHGSLKDHLMKYLRTLKDFREDINIMVKNLCFTGHTHIPLVYYKTSYGKEYIKKIDFENEVEIPKNSKCIINAGGVGQPRDHKPESCFAVFNSDTNRIMFKRLVYNVEKTKEKMRRLNMPEFLIERLSLGV